MKLGSVVVEVDVRAANAALDALEIRIAGLEQRLRALDALKERSAEPDVDKPADRQRPGTWMALGDAAEAVAFRNDWYANDLPAMQRLAVWLAPDSADEPLPTLPRLVQMAIDRAEKAEDAWRTLRERAGEEGVA